MYNTEEYKWLFTSVYGPERGAVLFNSGLSFDDLDARLEHYDILVHCMKTGDLTQLNDRLTFRVKPVSPTEFINGSLYLDKAGVVYPGVLEAMQELNTGPYVEAVLTGGIGCVDAETEFLTTTGWKQIGSWVPGDLVGQWDDGKMSFVHPEQFINERCDTMWHVQTKELDMALSDEHRVPTLDPKTDELRVHTMLELANQIPARGGFKGKFITTYYVDGVDVSPTQIAAQVMAIMIGEWENQKLRKVRIKSDSEGMEQAILRVLSEAGIPYHTTINKKGVWVSYRAPWDYTSFQEFGYQLSSQSYQALLKAIDSWRTSTLFPMVTTESREEADFLCFAGSAAGYRTTVTNIGKKTERFAINCNSESEVVITGKKVLGRLSPAGGRKYCFVVPSTYWVARRGGKVFITGNSGKTTLAQYTTAYQLYVLSCMTNPHYTFGLDPASEILFVFQSIHYGLAKNLEFNRFKALLEGSSYFNHVFPFRKDIESRLVFRSRIEVVPVSGMEQATIGQNVIGGIMDEVNYMSVVSESKQNVDGGEYNQAWALYNSITRRRKSRFMVNGKVYGMLCLVSSKRYPGQFTDKKEEERNEQIRTTGKTDIFLYDKCVWEIKPQNEFSDSDDWFWVFKGDESRQPMVVDDDAYARMNEDDQKYNCVHIPGEYRQDFERDIINALREIAGVSTLAAHPFMGATDKVAANFGKYKSVLTAESMIIGVDKLGVIKKNIRHTQEPRFAHIDLSVSGDRTGLVIGHVPEFTQMRRGEDEVETMPIINIDCALQIHPPRFGEINYGLVRNILYKLRELGLPIKWVTFDSFQSVDSQQILRGKGFVTGLSSMDVSIVPYTITKAALYDGRVHMDNHAVLFRELKSLEYDPKKMKVDHPPTGSKDVADALAGVVYGLTIRREIWARHGISATQVPPSLMRELEKGKE